MSDILGQLLSLAPHIYQTNIDKGFWEQGEGRSKGEMIALVNSELYESLEAHRKGRITCADDQIINLDNYEGDPWIACFKNHIKDTIQDEIADAVIRLLDYTFGWKIPVLEREYRKTSMGNYGHDVLRLNWYILLAFEEKEDIHPGKDFGYAFAAILTFCEWYNIDIVKHVKWKMRFNDSRPYKHNKSY
jgi:NTP pyrophosphatase (non-canonical NTP hydrolase)